MLQPLKGLTALVQSHLGTSHHFGSDALQLLAGHYFVIKLQQGQGSLLVCNLKCKEHATVVMFQ